MTLSVLTGWVPCNFNVLSINLGSMRYCRADSTGWLNNPSNWSRAHWKIQIIIIFIISNTKYFKCIIFYKVESYSE